MYLLQVRTHFDAAHHLVGYQGKCERVHGHSWRVRVAVAVDELDEIGLGVDFHELESRIERVMQRYDHTLLNELPEFVDQNPTTENLARLIFGEMAGQLPSNCSLREVEVWESDKFSAIYREENSQGL